ncbi:MAG: disulfide bond formation protein B, partial [Rhodospirillales bacterium]|nr:disulfide bond formation protein B [Rhodospirillales bacterium]
GADWARLAPAALAAACFGFLAFALIAQYAFDYDPCELCTYQRIAYGLGGAVALAAGVWRDRPRRRDSLLALSGAVLLAGFAVAAYHVGVEQHWWGSAFCAAQPNAAIATMSLADLKAQLAAAPEKPCDVVDWRLFGFSMATYNVGLFLLLGTGAVAASLAGRRERR